MEDIIYLTNDKIDSFVKSHALEDLDAFFDSISECISNIPSKAPVISKLIDIVSKSKPETIERIKGFLLSNDSDEISTISKAVYAAYMGAKSSITVEPISNIFSNVAIEYVSLEKYSNSIEIFSCYSILRKFNFYKIECLYRLRKYSHETIINALLIDECEFDISMIIELCNNEGFLEYLSTSICRFKKRTIIVGLIFVAYYNGKAALGNSFYRCLTTEEDRILLKNMFNEETIEFCKRIASIKNINTFFGLNIPISEPSFIKSAIFMEHKFSDKKEFFEKFLLVSSPSVTHFLSYMEMFQDKFALTEDEKVMFIKMLRVFHQDNPAYLDIVFEKMVKFSIISPRDLITGVECNL
jgi:hypothetical protein